MTHPQPQPIPRIDPQTMVELWPFPANPVPAGMLIGLANVNTPDGTRAVILVRLVTAAGAMFAYLDPADARRVFDDAVRLCDTATSGIERPLNGRLILP